MERAALIPRVPLSAWIRLAVYLLITTCMWELVFAAGHPSDSIDWAFAFLTAVVFVSFGLCFYFLLTLIPTLHRPAWVSQRQSVVLSVVCFAVHSVVAGLLTLLGVWPHGGLWFLGVMPFAVSS